MIMYINFICGISIFSIKIWKLVILNVFMGIIQFELSIYAAIYAYTDEI